jgi:transcriptional regulator with XRE-family HTH domain
MSIRKWTRASANVGDVSEADPVCYLSREHEALRSGGPRSGMCPRRADPCALKSGNQRRMSRIGVPAIVALQPGLPRTKVSLRLSQCDCTESFTTASRRLSSRSCSTKEGRGMTTVPGSPTVRRRRLAAELREIRESKGKSGDAVAAALKWSPSKISRYERAKTGLPPREVERLLDYYEITGPRRDLLLALAQDATRKGWWEDYGDSLSADYQQFIGLEDEASSIAVWHVDVFPGLFQTEAYARHIIGTYRQIEPVTPGMIDRLVKVRMRRQHIVDRESGLDLSVVIDESVLQRRVGDECVMYEQLQRLARDADRPNVRLQVLPLNGPHTVFVESFVIFRFQPDSEAALQDVVSTEHLRNDFSLEGEKETYLHWIAFQMLEQASLDPDRSKELILKTAGSHWSGGRQDP